MSHPRWATEASDFLVTILNLRITEVKKTISDFQAFVPQVLGRCHLGVIQIPVDFQVTILDFDDAGHKGHLLKKSLAH